MNREQRLQAATRWLSEYDGSHIVRSYRKLEQQKAAAAEEWSKRYPFSEGDFYFVAGHTSNGVPYGITWEEARKQGLIEDDEPNNRPETIDWDIG